MKKLIDYIIKEPTVNSPSRGYKFPFVAGEILSCDANLIAEKFFQEPEDKLERLIPMFNLSDSFTINVLEDDFNENFVDRKTSGFDMLDRKISDSMNLNREEIGIGYSPNFNPPAIEFGNLDIKESKEKERENKEKEMSIKDMSLNNVTN